ncbi:MAG: P-type conjugative transfer protein VirB9, partial [Alphaproteobacteria bacterium]|nr:P-type conjugative transfer protein VirB9 [Alphaproteobacteria bacterium]
NWRFSAQGSVDLEPEVVFDDGKETTFRFAGNREIPAIYLIASDGAETLAAKDVHGELVTVHATAREFRLRKGGDVLCVFNEAFDPVGVNRRTKTMSDGVLRLPKSPMPAGSRAGATQ